MSIKNKCWYDEMWNPITGTPRTEIRAPIRSHCLRFSGDVRINKSLNAVYEETYPGMYELSEPVKSQNSDKHFLIAPLGTEPTLHLYRMNTPKEKYITGRNLYVNAYADTFDMPDSWIDDILFVVRDNPQHNFILISDDRHMKDYFEIRPSLMPDNLWIGFQLTERTARDLSRLQMRTEKSHFFIEIDEVNSETLAMLEAFVNAPDSMANQTEWLLVGINTGTTSKNMLMKLSDIADRLSVPIFFDTEGADLPHVLPKAFNRHQLSDKKKALTWAKCGQCGTEMPKGMMYRIGWTKGKSSSTILGFLCEDCFEKYQKSFPSF